MLNMLAEITKISPSIPLIVALIASAVGFGALNLSLMQF